MSVNDDILEKMLRHAIYTERYKAGVVREIIALLNASDSPLIDEIAARLSRIEGRGYNLTQVEKKRLESLLKVVSSQRSAVQDDIVKALTGELKDFAAYEAEYQAVTFSNEGVSSKIPSKSALNAVVTQQSFQGRTLSDWMANNKQTDILRIQDAITKGIVEGQTTDQIVRRIRGTRAARYQDGILEISRRDAQSVVLTSIAHTQARAKMEFYEANSDIVQGVQYVAVLDSRTTTLCASRDGKVYPLDKAPPIPAHWRCRSAYVPYLGVEGGNRASQFGQVPAKTTYEEFLRKQSHEFQDSVLGKGKADLFRKGLKLERFVDKSGEAYTLKQLKARET